MKEDRSLVVNIIVKPDQLVAEESLNSLNPAPIHSPNYNLRNEYASRKHTGKGLFRIVI